MIKTILLFALVCSSFGYAEEITDLDKDVANNISSEYATCAAYFLVVSAAFFRPGDNEIAARFKKSGNEALVIAIDSAGTGRTAEMAEKVTTARLQSFAKGMMSEIENDWSNISILTNQYAAQCKFAMNDSPRFMNGVADKVLQQYGLD